MKTGYFANTKRWTKVHIVLEEEPICGNKIGKDMSFQFCAFGIIKDYIECESCKKKIKHLINKKS